MNQIIEDYIYEMKGVRVKIRPDAQYLNPRLYRIALTIATNYFNGKENK